MLQKILWESLLRRVGLEQQQETTEQRDVDAGDDPRPCGKSWICAAADDSLWSWKKPFWDSRSPWISNGENEMKDGKCRVRSFSMGWDALRDRSCLTESTEAPASVGIPGKNPAPSRSCIPSISSQAVKTFLVSSPTMEHTELIPRKRDRKTARGNTGTAQAGW